MNQIKIRYQGPLQGDITPPSDKSISHRAVMFSSLADGASTIRNFLYAEDPLRTLHAFRQMGVDIDESDKERIIVKGKGIHGLSKPAQAIDCGNSGTTMRLMSGILAAQPFSTVLTGDKFLLKRPMARIIKPLSEMGACIIPAEGEYPPLHITGQTLKPLSYNSPIASAQVKSAVLLAGLFCKGKTTVIEPGKSRDHTERMLKACGADIEIQGLSVSIQGGKRLSPFDISIPGDMSSAAFFMAAALIIPESDIVIRHVGINPTRTGIIEILKTMGGNISLMNTQEVSGEPVADIHVTYSELSGTDISGDLVLKAIDEFPVICVAASLAKGLTKITGAAELRVKESDRIASMARELSKMGVQVDEFNDGLSIKGSGKLRPASVLSHGDHRIAMSLAIAGLTADGETTVEDTECIDTSFPGFLDLLDNLTGNG